MFDIDITLDNDLIVSVFFHVTILFFILYFLFFKVISKKGETVLKNNIDNISDNIPTILDEINNEFKSKINWKEVRENAVFIRDHPNPEIEKRIDENNDKYKKIGLYVGFGLILLTILVIIYYIFYKKEQVNIGYIIKESLFTFLLIGIIEFVFFTMTASQYVPAYPTSIGGIVLNQIQENIQKI